MNEPHGSLKRGEIVVCFTESAESFHFDYGGEFDTEVGSVPKNKADRI